MHFNSTIKLNSHMNSNPSKDNQNIFNNTLNIKNNEYFNNEIEKYEQEYEETTNKNRKIYDDLIENNISPLERLSHQNWYVRQQTFIQLQAESDT